MNRFVLPKSAKIGLLSVAGIGVAFTAFMGFAHTAPGRPVLAWMSGKTAKHGGACPLGFDVAQTPAEKEEGRRRFASTHSGTDRANARPALGFVLDKTTRSDVMAWASTHQVKCVKPKSGADLDCSNIPATLLPESFRGTGVKSLWLNFGEADHLISVIAIRRAPSAEEISATYEAVTAEVAKEAGPASMTQGASSAAVLASGALRQASSEYRFHNYYALARATNMGDGFVLTEEYRSLPD